MKRGRKSGPDDKKIELILEVLKKNPDGIWIRELARQCDLDKSTVCLYLNKHLKDKIQDLTDHNLPVRMVKLKDIIRIPEYIQ